MINLAFIVSKEEQKNIRGGQKKKLETKRGRGRNKKQSPVLGPALIWATEGGDPGPGEHCFYSDFSQCLQAASPLPIVEFLASHAS